MKGVVAFVDLSFMGKSGLGIQISGSSANRGFGSTGNGCEQLENIELEEKWGWEPALRNSKT